MARLTDERRAEIDRAHRLSRHNPGAWAQTCAAAVPDLLAEIDALRADLDRTRDEVADLEDCREWIARVWQIVGCDYTESRDDRARLLHCMREEWDRLRADLAAERAKQDIGSPMLTSEQLGQIAWEEWNTNTIGRETWETLHESRRDRWRDIGDKVAAAVRLQWDFNAKTLAKRLDAERAAREAAERERDAIMSAHMRQSLNGEWSNVIVVGGSFYSRDSLEHAIRKAAGLADADWEREGKQ